MQQEDLWKPREQKEAPNETSRKQTATDTPPTPTDWEVEKLRLILSTYQDGTGMLPAPNDMTLPGWRDFERATAAAFGGKAQESKYVFDVILTDAETPSVKYGISCKMRGELNRITEKDGRITMELSNSAKKFWMHLQTQGISEANYREKPTETGIALIELVTSWHEAESSISGGTIHLERSSYLVLSWNKRGEYQLHQFPLELPNPRSLKWYFPTKITKRGEEPADRLCGMDETGTIFEWYGTSGGQLKYYPLARTAIWASHVFRLEPLPPLEDMEYGIVAKAKAYYPTKWQE